MRNLNIRTFADDAFNVRDHSEFTTSLQLDFNEIATMPSLKALQSLKHLSLRGNRITSFSGDDLATLFSLEYLDISLNPIHHWSPPKSPPSNFQNLASLIISKCGLTDNILNEILRTFSSTDRLDSIDLSYNHLVDLSGYKITSRRGAHGINLDGNLLRRINDKTLLESLGGFSNVRLNHNKILSFGLSSSLSLAKNASTVNLYLEGNHLSRIPDFNSFPLLTSVRLGRNRIVELEKDRLNHPLISYIDLSDNRIRFVNSNILKAKRLYTLNLNRNRLTTLKPMCFANLPALRNLYLAGNRLDISTFISGSPFAGENSQLRLALLNLAHNQLSSVPKCISELAYLRSLDISDNFITEVQHVSDLKQLYKLSLANNPLIEIDQKRVPNTLRQLELQGDIQLRCSCTNVWLREGRWLHAVGIAVLDSLKCHKKSAEMGVDQNHGVLNGDRKASSNDQTLLCFHSDDSICPNIPPTVCSGDRPSTTTTTSTTTISPTTSDLTATTTTTTTPPTTITLATTTSKPTTSHSSTNTIITTSAYTITSHNPTTTLHRITLLQYSQILLRSKSQQYLTRLPLIYLRQQQP